MLRRLLVCLLLGCLPAWADKSQMPDGTWVAGVPGEQFVYFAAAEGQGRQHMQNWCWAACIQMVLNYHGLYVQQEQIVSRVFGGLVDRPAGPTEIMSALQGQWPDSRQRYSEVMADTRNLDPYSVVQDLEYRWPLIVGLQGPRGGTGHAYVLTAVYYNLMQDGSPLIRAVVLRDPYPGRQSRVEMGIQEFMQRCTFATRVHVKRM